MAESPPPPPPKSGGYGRPAGMSRELDSAHPFDVAQLGIGVLLFIASLLPFYSYSFAAFSGSVNAWHGFFGWFGVLLGMAAASVLAAVLFGNTVISSARTIVLALFAGSAVFLLLALLVVPGGDFPILGLDSGHAFGYWLALLLSLAGTAMAVRRHDLA